MSKLSYKSAGVDIDAGNKFVSNIKPFVKDTFRKEVLGGIGGFSSLVKLPSGIKNPVLVSGTDGVGTKLKFAFMANKFDTVGIDLVAMCVNDIIVGGAEPLFFLDYFATGKLEVEKATEVVKGIADGCKQSGAALVGGETAEMPDFYPKGEFDLAGFAVGVVDEEKIIDGTNIKAGDVLIGIKSSGVHSNGFSLVRKIVFDKLGLKIDDIIPELNKTVAEVFLEPTTIYVKLIQQLLKKIKIKGMVHITGGGFYENIPRILPKGLGVEINGDLEIPLLFRWLKNSGDLEESEMFTTFNCGTGYV
jgi:phosphoribosylformylglycinamidine cyclo-ligase